MACHFGEEEDAVEGQLRQVSQSAFNSVLLFVLKEVRPPAVADARLQQLLARGAVLPPPLSLSVKSYL